MNQSMDDLIDEVLEDAPDAVFSAELDETISKILRQANYERSMATSQALQADRRNTRKKPSRRERASCRAKNFSPGLR